MGNCTQVESFQMASQSEDNSIVMRSILAMVESAAPVYQKEFYISDTGRLYTTMHGVLSYAREILEAKITERALQRNLKTLMRTDVPFDCRGILMYEIDVDALLAFAGPWGIKCEKLKEARTKAQGQLD